MFVQIYWRAKIQKIRKLCLQVEVNGTETDGLSLQRRLPDLCRHWLTPAIGRTLDNFDPAEGDLFIERLEIDAGSLNLEDLEHGLAEAVSRTMEKLLGKQLPPADSSAWSTAAGMQLKTEQQSAQEAFIYFLETGALPWWFHLQDGQSLEQAILASWLEVENIGAPSRHFDIEILDALLSDAARIRLVHQFSPVFLEKMLLKLSPVQLRVVPEVLQTLKSSKVADIELGVIIKHFWQTVLLHVAQRKVKTAFELIEEMSHTLQDKYMHIPVLTSLLQHLSSGGGNKSASMSLDKINPRSINQSGETQKSSNAITTKRQTYRVHINHSFVDTEQGKNGRPSQSSTLLDISYADSASNKSKSKPISNDDKAKSHANPYLKQLNVLHRTKILKNAKAMQNINHHGSAYKNKESGSNIDITKLNNVNPEGISKLVKVDKLHIKIDVKEGVYINCAGIILLHPFLPRFFETLGIASEDNLLQPERALCLLHYLATGQTVAPEYELLLPKLLCNVPFEQPTESNVNLTPEEIEESAALLDAVVGHWSALQNTSADSLRGTFLLRPGKLSERGDGDWLLQVENRTFDILLDQLPWGFGMVKLPWMDKVLRVEWR